MVKNANTSNTALLALATLGDMIQIEPFFSVEPSKEAKVNRHGNIAMPLHPWIPNKHRMFMGVTTHFGH
jgi:hypothetical protein